MRIRDWSSDVCSSDLGKFSHPTPGLWCVRCSRISCPAFFEADIEKFCFERRIVANRDHSATEFPVDHPIGPAVGNFVRLVPPFAGRDNRFKIVNFAGERAEEHTSELQSLMRRSYAVSRLQKQKYTTYNTSTRQISATKRQ